MDGLRWIQLKACAQIPPLGVLALDQLQHCEPTVAATFLRFDPPENIYTQLFNYTISYANNFKTRVKI